jgi:hypothetical protein
MTKKEIVEFEDELDERFRKTIVQRKGLHQGVIKEAFEEAVEMWINDTKQLKKDVEKIAKGK